MLFPIGDDNPRRSVPVVTIALIAANVAVFLANNVGASESATTELFLRWGYDAAHPVSVQAVTSMFLHGGWMHLIGNMWMLWIVGDNVEDKFGRLLYPLLYLIGGLVAVWTYSGIASVSGPVPGAMEMFGRDHPPLVGASGAVYAVMGMYLVLFPEVRVRLLFVLFVFVQQVRVPAKWFIGFSIAFDAIVTAMSRGPASGGVATAAHVGGGVFGIVVARILKKSVGGGAAGDVWDVHTGFASHGGGDARASAPADWHAPPPGIEDRAGEIEETLVGLVRAQRTRDAIDVYPAYVALRRERPLPGDVQLEIAHEFYRQGLARDGIAAYRRYLETHRSGEHAAEAAFRIGVLYARVLGDREAAVPWLRKAAFGHADPKTAEFAQAELRRLGG